MRCLEHLKLPPWHHVAIICQHGGDTLVRCTEVFSSTAREEGREGGREGGREEGREGGREVHRYYCYCFKFRFRIKITR